MQMMKYLSPLTFSIALIVVGTVTSGRAAEPIQMDASGVGLAILDM